MRTAVNASFSEAIDYVRKGETIPQQRELEKGPQEMVAVAARKATPNTPSPR